MGNVAANNVNVLNKGKAITRDFTPLGIFLSEAMNRLVEKGSSQTI